MMPDQNEIGDFSSDDKPPNKESRGLPNVVSPYLKKLIEEKGKDAGPLGLQFIAKPEVEDIYLNKISHDPLDEDEHSPVPGLVYKYEGKDGTFGRALLTLTYKCASYCRFCTRGRVVGTSKPSLSVAQIDDIVRFIKSRPELNEVILSGGDPLTAPPEVLRHTLRSLSELPQIKIIRIGTRLPIHNPLAIGDSIIESIKLLEDPFILIHINHPDELTEETRKVIRRFRRECFATVFSQSVFLKGVNDNFETLYKLFNELAILRVRPYYLYRNDPVPWAKHFTVPFEKEVEIVTKLKANLSGLAGTFRYTVDAPNGYGKIEVPLNFWNWDIKSDYKDFKGLTHRSPFFAYLP